MGSQINFDFEDPEDSYWNQTSLFAQDHLSHLSNIKESTIQADESSKNIPSKSFFDDESESTYSFVDVQKLNLESAFKDADNPACSAVTEAIPKKSIQRTDTDFPQGKTPRKSSSFISDFSACSSSVPNDANLQLDYKRIKDEHRKLREHYENLYDSRHDPLPINDTIEQILARKPASLDLYKSYKSKLEVLDASIETMNWNAVTNVLIFLKSTLSTSIFHQIIVSKTTVANCYLSYLRETNNYTELMDTLLILRRNEEAAMLEFEVACHKSTIRQKIEALRICYAGSFRHPNLTHEAKFIKDYIQLLEKHITS